jgi:hypothetical protein
MTMPKVTSASRSTRRTERRGKRPYRRKPIVVLEPEIRFMNREQYEEFWELIRQINRSLDAE